MVSCRVLFRITHEGRVDMFPFKYFFTSLTESRTLSLIYPIRFAMSLRNRDMADSLISPQDCSSKIFDG